MLYNKAICYKLLLPGGSCITHNGCENGSYCDSNRCVSSCENSLECTSGVCTEVSFGRMCKEDCSEFSDSCQEGQICIGKDKLYLKFV